VTVISTTYCTFLWAMYHFICSNTSSIIYDSLHNPTHAHSHMTIHSIQTIPILCKSTTICPVNTFSQSTISAISLLTTSYSDRNHPARILYKIYAAIYGYRMWHLPSISPGSYKDSAYAYILKLLQIVANVD